MANLKEKHTPVRNIIRLFFYLWQESRFFTVLLFFLTIILGIIPAAELWVIGLMVNKISEVFNAGEVIVANLLTPLFIVLIGMMLMRNWIRLLSDGIQDYLRDKVGGKLQKEVIEKASEVELGFYDQSESYDQLQRANIGLKESFINVYLDSIHIVETIVTIVAFLLTLTVGHWSLVPIVACGALFSIWLKLKRAKQKYRFDYEVLTPIRKHTQYFTGLLTTKGFAKELRIFGSRDYVISKWREKQLEQAEKVFVDEKKEFNYTVINDGLLNLILLGASIFIAYLVVQGNVTIGYYVILLQVVIRMQEEMEGLMGTIRFMYQRSLFTENLFSFLDRKIKKSPKASVKLQAPLTGAIRFENVWFKYPNSEKWIIRGLSFSVRPKETISIIGENGAGKSTIIKLLLGLYTFQKGMIYLDDIPIDRIDEEDLRRQMSAVFQDFTKFELSLRESIGIGKIENLHNEAAIAKVVKESGVDEWINRLDNGYDTYLSKAFGGTELSGGQWQKVALARSLMKEAEIFILDEPTSALDPIAELAVFQQFKKLAEDRTAILISHRMGTARLADKIIVIEEGKKIEEGTHQTLMQNNQVYAQLFKTQAKLYHNKKIGEDECLKL